MRDKYPKSGRKKKTNYQARWEFEQWPYTCIDFYWSAGGNATGFEV